MGGKMWWKSVLIPLLWELGKAFLIGGAMALGQKLADARIWAEKADKSSTTKEQAEPEPVVVK